MTVKRRIRVGIRLREIPSSLRASKPAPDHDFRKVDALPTHGRIRAVSVALAILADRLEVAHSETVVQVRLVARPLTCA